METRRAREFVLVAILLVIALALPVAVGSHGEDVVNTTTPPPDRTHAIPAGDRFQGSIGVQAAEVEGEMETRTFGVAFRAADSNATKAAIVVEQTARLQSRLSALQRQRKAAEQARENGSIGKMEYRARVTTITVRSRTAGRLAARTAGAAASLPAKTRAEQGVNVSAIRKLSRTAAAMGDEERAEIARSIAGPRAGQELAAEYRPSLPQAEKTEKDATPTVTEEPTLTPTPTVREEATPTDEPTPTPTPTVQEDETPTEYGRSAGEGTQSWRFGPPQSTTGIVGAQSTEGSKRPLLEVPVETDGSARVTLVLVFDLGSDSAQQAFETLREDERARADVRDRFRNRMASIADQSAAVTNRSMRVHDPEMELERAEDSETGVVRVSVAWEGLAAVEGDHLVVTEPFASGFTPDREFRVRITAPDEYRVTTTQPDPVQQDNASVAWAKGTDLDGFTLVFSHELQTPLPGDRVEELQPTRTISPAGTGGQAPGFGGIVALVSLAGGLWVAHRSR